MSFEIQDAVPADAGELTQIFFATFGGDFNRTMFPQTPDVTAWWERNFESQARQTLAKEGNEVLLKIMDNEGTIAAFAKWGLPVHAGSDLQEEEPAAWAPSSDKDLCERFFSGMDAQHHNWMEKRPHYYLNMLGVHPSQQGRGLASKLLRWGLTRADAEGLEVYLSASPEGKPMYEKYGFRTVESFSPFPDYVQEAMIRPATIQ
ncbi:unnamed protein product [Penicillium salamii]|uniref:N-acetyltransferase domain-containing protein n=1 Tax=Penicillium salamii TaxID=1612424 RepID=A0A9W4JPW1_9EURO|nr:unnamed protein product [Penicillium salamii]CAG8006870.1 unnamed protein product [Penicillium salamii]CAG8252667.1 unnamed protein product [Penicillium salamii]CAG8268086.1 unnamed protein product [Penicillium salamii]CAG8274768.1 unnamed protein product [Penicillium salamii]